MDPERRSSCRKVSQSLSGWDGVFHGYETIEMGKKNNKVAIPFRVGWGFSLITFNEEADLRRYRRNPFQGGMGFFTEERDDKSSR